MNKAPQSINLRDYFYELPENRIAKKPLANRTDSKLLHYNKGEISHYTFKEITNLLPDNAHLIFNDTRVIPARLHFTKSTGALIEIFLLEPLEPTSEVASAMLVKNKCQWRCMIGNLKKWKEDVILEKSLDDATILKAKLIDRAEQIVELDWGSDLEFVHIVEAAGKIPLPPYINREVTFEDKERYQTVYSNFQGAVAAPTAGLHFDDSIIGSIKNSGRMIDYLTLHVSAGTFQPIKVENAIEHHMHSEQIVISRQLIDNLLSNNFTVAVGTTSMRTLESLYWYGVKLLENDQRFFIEKLYPYQNHMEVSREDALNAILLHMSNKKLDQITGVTEIFLFPGYHFRICKGLVTNYHLPESTLILLIACFIGDDWRKVYQEALTKNYRFLSYGDSSLLIP